MALLGKFIEETNRAVTQQAIADTFSDFIKPLGFDCFFYAHLTPHPSINRPQDFGIFSTCSDDWIDRYVEQRYYVTDPLIHHLFRRRTTFSWSEALAQFPRTPDKVKKQFDDLAQMGMTEGINVPLHGQNFELATIAVSSRYKEIRSDQDTKSIIQALASQFHTAFCLLEINQPKDFGQQHLTKREIEILLWLAEGKSVPDTATIISTSEDNVKYHLKRIYKKLHVTDRIQAVLRAVALGYINPHSVELLRKLPD